MLNRFSAESESQSSLRDISRRSLAGRSDVRGEPNARSRSISPLLILRAAVTWEWLKASDGRSGGLKRQLQDEMTQVGLLSALMLTIVSAFLMLFHEPRQYSQWQLGASVIIWTVAFTLMFNVYCELCLTFACYKWLQR